MFKRVIITVITIALIIGITTAIIALGRGYRFNPETSKLSPTGLLVASSFPTGAQVFVDDHLVSATNSTISLPPGIYNVRISKDGYTSWSKKLKVQGEVVTKADALLLPIAPDLRPITTTGALNPSLSFDGSQIAYGIATASAQKQGVWIMDLTDKPLSLQSPARQIARDLPSAKFSESQFIWSPDSKQMIAKLNDAYYLLNTDNFNDQPQDITLTNELQFTTWTQELNDNQEALLKSLKPKLQQFIRENARIISWSPDEAKLLYEATSSALMPQMIMPALIGTSTQTENRNLSPRKIYTYDIKEDKNFYLKDYPEFKPQEKETNPESGYLSTANYYLSPPFRWISDSDHLIVIEKNEQGNFDEIKILDYDNTNKAVVYSSGFVGNYVFPFPSGIRIIILTTLNPNITTPNLYAINLN